MNFDIQGDNNYVAGRDINVYSPSTSLKEALEQIINDINNDKEMKSFISDLLDYTTEREEKIIGLENKLKDGNREDLIDDAIYLKERFAKKLLKNQLSLKIQKAYAHILGDINSTFRGKIKPLINEGKKKSAIDKAILEEILDYIYSQVNTHDCLGLNKDDIHGMLYYLTGKCHIKWRKQ